jgi:pSer/pThr/pTyr-binding forkhead associated (FHA) protein
MAVISLRYNDTPLQSYPIGMGDTFMIGRHQVNDIVIDNLAVSFQHAKIEAVGDEFLLIDLKSENGSFVNEQRVKAHWLCDGDVITIGKHSLVFSDPQNRNAPGKMSSIIETMQMDTEKFRELLRKNNLLAADAAGGSPPTGVLAVLSDTRKDLPLGPRPVRIGRAATSDIVAGGFGVAPTAAVINRLEDGWYLSYTGGWTRVRVNDRRVRTSVKLNRLDVITLGRLTMQFLTGAGGA